MRQNLPVVFVVFCRWSHRQNLPVVSSFLLTFKNRFAIIGFKKWWSMRKNKFKKKETVQDIDRILNSATKAIIKNNGQNIVFVEAPYRVPGTKDFFYQRTKINTKFMN